MNDLQRFLQWTADRLEEDTSEETDLELKRNYDAFGQGQKAALFEVADLVASLANDPSVDGFRALVVGPSSGLDRPAWLSDEAQLPDRLRRYFEGGVVPRVEVARRKLSDGREFDAVVVVDKSETPYVTRDRPGGIWVVRVRTATGRRTATRSELRALCAGAARTPRPVRAIDVKVQHSNKALWSIVITNVGTVDVQQIAPTLQDDSDLSFVDKDNAVELLKPGERDVIEVFYRGGGLGRSRASERVGVLGHSVDGEEVAAETIFTPSLG
jgi:hypothetical protein